MHYTFLPLHVYRYMIYADRGRATLASPPAEDGRFDRGIVYRPAKCNSRYDDPCVQNQFAISNTASTSTAASTWRSGATHTAAPVFMGVFDIAVVTCTSDELFDFDNDDPHFLAQRVVADISTRLPN